MPAKIGTVGRSTLTSAALPAKTKSYTVISHNFVITTILQTLQKHGFQVESEEYRCTPGAQVAQGTFHINYQGDPELGMVYSFSNSYDKTLRFRAAIGARVLINDAYMITEDDHWKRKHTGTSDQETADTIEEHIQNAQIYFDQLKTAKDAMKTIEIDKDTFGATVGRLLFKGLLAIDQVSLILREYNNPSFKYTTGPNNLWTCYNHIIYALKQTHPSKWMQNQAGVHLYFATTWNLIQFDEEPEEISFERPSDDFMNQYPVGSTFHDPETNDLCKVIKIGQNEFGQDVHFCTLIAHTESFEKEETNRPDVGDTVLIKVEDYPDVNVGDDVNVYAVKAKVLAQGEDEDGETVWVCEVTEILSPVTEEVKEETEEEVPAEDTEEQVILPGFGAALIPEPYENEQEETKDHDAEEEAISEDVLNQIALDEQESEGVEQLENENHVQEIIEDKPLLNSFEERVDAVKKVLPTVEPAEESNVDNSTEEYDDELFYFLTNEFPGITIGEVIMVEEDCYEVINIEEVDKNEYLVCKRLVDGCDSEEEITDAATHSYEDPDDDVLENKTSTIEEGVSAIILPSVEPVEQPEQQVSESAPAEDPLETITEQVTESTETPDDLFTATENNPVRDAIGKEIEDIYGTPQEFTYTSTGTQYNIVLATGETITLAVTYIDNLIN